MLSLNCNAKVRGGKNTVGSLGVHTLLVCTGGEYELYVYANGRSYSCVSCECTLMLGVKNVTSCVG